MAGNLITTKDYMTTAAEYKNNAYSIFLHTFRTLTTEERIETIKDAPDNSELNIITAAMIAATAECLAKKYSLEIPKWVYEDRFILDTPFYGMAIQRDYQAYLRETSLPEFARRNLFLGDNIMSIG